MYRWLAQLLSRHRATPAGSSGPPPTFVAGPAEAAAPASRGDVEGSRIREMAIETALNAVAIADVDGRLNYVNPAFVQLWQLDSAEQVYGRSALDFWERPEEAAKVIAAVVAHGQWLGEMTARRRDGSVAVLQVAASSVPDAAGRPTCLMASFVDITARAELAARLDKIGRNAPGVVYQYQLRPDGSSCFPYASEGIQHIYGVTPAEVVTDAAPVFAVLHPDELEHISASIATSARTLREWHEVYRVRHPMRGEIWVEGRATPERLPDGGTLWHGVILDVTERQRAELALRDLNDELEHRVTERTAELVRARDEAELANRAKSEFLSRMSHEIRTPLNGVLGTLDLLERTTLDERQRRLAEIARRSSESLLEIINDVLDFAKIEAGRLELESIAFDPRDVVNDTVEMLSGHAQRSSLRLVSRIEPGVPARVVGDPGRLRQVLTNLVGNAVKFTARGEVEVRLAPGRAGRPLAPTQCVLQLDVRDTGIGIAAEALPRLFSAFSQADASTTRRFGGTGLGLAISRQLVEMMGGSIEVQSTPGQGSTFSFQVVVQAGEPATAAAPRRGDDAVAAHAGGAATPRFGARVLLAEDNAVNREIVTAWLDEHGCDVVVAENGRRAVELAGHGGIDLALMDVSMPEMDGLEATAIIRRREAEAAAATPDRRLPIIALTANALTGDRERCLAAGMDDYISKPFREEQFLTILSRWLPPRQS